jgi:hypothetical protein
VSALLQRLVRRRLIRPEPSSFPGEDPCRFGHILIRDAAYAAIGKERRAELHEAFADWLEARQSPYDEIVGYHLEQAYRYRAELGPVGEGAQALARHAAQVLEAAGLRARAHGDHTAAANLNARGLDLLPREDRLRVSLLGELGDTLFWLGRYVDAGSALADAVDAARRVGDTGLEWHARLGQARLATQTATRAGLNVELERTAKEALAVFEELHDSATCSSFLTKSSGQSAASTTPAAARGRVAVHRSAFSRAEEKLRGKVLPQWTLPRMRNVPVTHLSRT